MSLEALERSDLSRLPGGIFTRAFIRAYAQEVGLDPERTIQDFIAELPPEAVSGTAHPPAIEDSEQLESDRKVVATAVKLILVSLPIAGFLIYYGMHRQPRLSPSPAPTPAPAASLPGASPETPPAAGASPTNAPPLPPAAPVQPAGLTMEIAPKGDSWVSVTVDGEQLFSGVMHAGDRRQIAARQEISLNVGDAGAFAYTLNGRQGRPLGGPGEVVSRRITVADAKDYVTP
jgi:cytoskeletal protein RodZ